MRGLRKRLLSRAVTSATGQPGRKDAASASNRGAGGYSVRGVSEPEGGARRFPLWPPGPIGHLGGPSRLALASGVLHGKLEDGSVTTWSSAQPSEPTYVMWPGEYGARVEPLEIFDERNRLVAGAGQEVQLVGGHVPSHDPRLTPSGRLFVASHVTDKVHR